MIPVHLSEANIFLPISKTLLLNTVFLRVTVHENTLERCLSVVSGYLDIRHVYMFHLLGK
jgi:hypothetical protein